MAKSGNNNDIIGGVRITRRKLLVGGDAEKELENLSKKIVRLKFLLWNVLFLLISTVLKSAFGEQTERYESV